MEFEAWKESLTAEKLNEIFRLQFQKELMPSLRIRYSISTDTILMILEKETLRMQELHRKLRGAGVNFSYRTLQRKIRELAACGNVGIKRAHEGMRGFPAIVEFIKR